MQNLAADVQSINDKVIKIKQQCHNDARLTVFNVEAEFIGSSESPTFPILLTGQVLTQKQREQVIGCLPLDWKNLVNDQIVVMLNETTPRALVNRTVTDLRAEPRIRAERVSQVLLGEPVQILSQQDGWSWVRVVHDGYLGWTQTGSLLPRSQNEIENYIASLNARTAIGWLPAYISQNRGNLNQPTGIIPFGMRLNVAKVNNQQAFFQMPDGRMWQVSTQGLLIDHQQPKSDPEGIRLVLDYLQHFIGVPYLWGGRTTFGYDCSGLAQAFYSFIGKQIPRDADQQFQTGQPVTGKPEPGDLLFFGEQKRDEQIPGKPRYENITHVAISLGGNECIHANGAAWGISINSLHPRSTVYRAWLRENLVGVRRYL